MKSPLVLSFEVIVMFPLSPEPSENDDGVRVRLAGPLAVTVPLPLAIVTIRVVEPPFLLISTLDGVARGAQAGGLGMGVGVGVACGLPFPFPFVPPFPFGVGVGLAVAVGVGVGVGSEVLGVGVGVASSSVIGVAVACGKLCGVGAGETSSSTSVFRATSGMASS